MRQDANLKQCPWQHSAQEEIKGKKTTTKQTKHSMRQKTTEDHQGTRGANKDWYTQINNNTSEN
eukprot:12190018-Ditylum_brightwellii.AAC.1